MVRNGSNAVSIGEPDSGRPLTADKRVLPGSIADFNSSPLSLRVGERRCAKVRGADADAGAAVPASRAFEILA
jgi:hypothetical protein